MIFSDFCFGKFRTSYEKMLFSKSAFWWISVGYPPKYIKKIDSFGTHAGIGIHTGLLYCVNFTYEPGKVVGLFV